MGRPKVILIKQHRLFTARTEVVILWTGVKFAAILVFPGKQHTIGTPHGWRFGIKFVRC
jgi:hypothetical protein